MEIICRPADVMALQDLFEQNDGIMQDGLASLACCEANWAYGIDDKSFGDLPQGIPFYGTHGSGGEYGPGQFCTDGVTFRYQQNNDHGLYCIRFDVKTREPNAQDIADVQSFMEFYERVHSIVSLGAAKVSQPEGAL
jgi:hypothetical protein